MRVSDANLIFLQSQSQEFDSVHALEKSASSNSLSSEKFKTIIINESKFVTAYSVALRKNVIVVTIPLLNFLQTKNGS